MDREPLTITAAAPLIRDGQLTPSDLLEQCLARIDRYEEKVRAWVYLDRDRARTEAVHLTDEIKKGHYRGPLHGIPVGIKDIIDVFDMPTGCGSKLWANSYARRDATCVQRLREAGALILGKTVTTPYAFLDPSPTRNPWNLERTPGGSSSGSAAAVACGMCLAALGTQTGGSTTRPASFCGVCSLKPTYGHVSQYGVFPLAPSLDHVGLMANTVRDLAIVYPAMTWIPAGYEPEKLQPSTKPPTFVTPGRFFWERSDTVIRDMLDDVAGRLRRAGAEVVMIEPPDGFESLPSAHLTIMAAEAAAIHEEAARTHPDAYPPKITELIHDGLSRHAVEYVRAKQLAADIRSKMVAAMTENDWCYLTPAAPSPAPTPETTGNPVFNSIWSLFGIPTVSLPAGSTSDNLPVGLQLIGQPHQLANLFESALQVEQVLAMGPRPLPQ